MNIFSETEDNSHNTKLIIELSSHVNIEISVSTKFLSLLFQQISENEMVIVQLNGELEEKDIKIKELEENFKNLQLEKDNTKTKITNNNRYNSAPSKSPVDKFYNSNTKINVKEFIPVDDVQSDKNNSYAIGANNTSHDISKQSFFSSKNKNNLLNSSISSFSN
jgi:hypothetical protein